MRFQCSALVWVALGCAAFAACEDEADVLPRAERVEEEAQPQPPGASDEGDGQREEEEPAGSAGACMPSACPAVRALGGVVPGCCQNDGACGGLVLVNGRPLCAPPNVDNLVEGAGPVVMQLSEEAVVSDARCNDREIFGTRLPGCCDSTGVCGVSTAPVAAGSPGAIPGLNLPVTCVSPGEAARLGAGMAVLGAEAPQPCGGGMSGGEGGMSAEPPAVEPPAVPPEVPADAGASDAG